MVKFIIQSLRDRLKRDEKPGQPKSTDTPPPAAQELQPAAEASAPQPSADEEAPRPRRRRSRTDESNTPAASGNTPARRDPAAPEGRGQGDPSQKNETGEAPRRRRRRRRKPGAAGSDGQPRTDHAPDSAEPTAAARAPAEPEPAAPWDPATFAVEPMEGKTRFQDLEIPASIMHGIADLGFQYCTPIQAEILPATLEGRDAMGKAQTGTGKSAAFLIAIFNQLLRNPPEKPLRKGTPRALVIAPTRELAMQIDKDARDIGKYTGLTTVAVFGGMDYQRQQRLLTEQQVDIVIATPGRLLDFKRRLDVHLGHVEIMVIDEADRMLDMGFIPDVRNIIHSTPTKNNRQTMLFSATLTADVIRLAGQWTRDAISIEIEPEQVAVDTVHQIVYITTTEAKFPLLLNIIQKEKPEKMLVFANRRDQTRKLTEWLDRYDISTAMLSGDVPQMKRVKTLENFREGKIQVLVATDVAGRGIHVDGVSHVVNFTLPQDAEDYVHRIGRTGRAGKSGISISFACESDSFQIPAIEEYMGRELKCEHPDDSMLEVPSKPPYSERHRRAADERKLRAESAGSGGRGGRSGGGGGRRSGGGGGRRPSRSHG